MTLPVRAPDYEIIWPAVDGEYDELEMTGGVHFEDSLGTGFIVGTDERGRYLATPPGAGSFFLSITTDPTDSEVQSFAAQVVAVLPMDSSSEGDGQNVAVGMGPNSVVLTASHLSVPTGRVWVSSVWVTSDGHSEQRPTGFADNQWSARRGQPIQWSLSDPYAGAGSPESGEGNAPEAIYAGPPTSISMERDFSMLGLPSARLYAVNVWVNFPPGGMWHSRQRQNAAGNAGGLPSRRRQNGGYAGGYPSRRRQTGL